MNSSIPIFFIMILILAVGLPGVDALTKEEKQKQMAEREKALAEAKAYGGAMINTIQDETPYKIIAIELTKTCKAAIKTNSTDCPTYKDFVSLDTTDQRYYGKFVEKNGIVSRAKPLLNNPHIIDQNRADYLICVDCPKKVLPHAKIIEIAPKNFKWISRSDSKIINNTRYEYQDRFVEDCKHAIIPFYLLNDTINYLKSGCIDTKFTPIIKIEKPYSKLSYDGREHKYQEWLKQAKEIAMKLAREKCLKSQKC